MPFAKRTNDADMTRQPNLIPPPDPQESGHELPTDGVDVSLIRWALSLTPAQRLQVLQNQVETILRLRRAKTKS